MKAYKRMYGLRKLVAVGMLGTVLAFPFGGCDLGEFTTTTTTTLSGREVIAYLVRSVLLTPLETAVNNGIDALFDRLEDED